MKATSPGPARHPCFSLEGAHKFARLHLPVAPACNIQCAYCNRKYDCVNESRPGVTSSILSPEQAVARFLDAKKRYPYLSIVGVAGPGDALANADATFRTFRMIREIDPSIGFCLSTNGIALPEHLPAIREIGVGYVTVTINTRRLKTAEALYPWVRTGDGTLLKGFEAASHLIARQEDALKALEGTGIVLKVNTICIPGVNDGEVEEIAEFAKRRGASMMNVMPFIPTPGTYFERFPMVSKKTLSAIQNRLSTILPMVRHCQQCRADAAGPVLDAIPVFPLDAAGIGAPSCLARRAAGALPGRVAHIAVASAGGFLVDLHFGHVQDLLVYEVNENETSFVGRRPIEKYCVGPQACDEPEERLARAVAALDDCEAIIVLRIGDAPRKALESKGFRVVMSTNRVEDAVREVYEAVAAQASSRAGAGAS
ncbi:MAG: radical SAM protein [bacterium]|nr:radical SAM protein [bacterium]